MTQTRTQSNSPANEAQAARARSSSLGESLDVFVGEWHTEGRQFSGPIGPAAEIGAVQTFEWLDGHVFLIHRFDGHVGDSKASCVEIMGYNRDTGTCRAHTFYNNGLTNVWDMERHEGSWRLLGDWNMSGVSLKVRCTINFNDDHTVMTSKWESSSDGTKWQIFWETRARRAQAMHS